MAQTPALLVSNDSAFDYDTAADAVAGDVVEVGTIPGIIKRDVDYSENARGTIVFDGVWDVPQVAAIITAGDAVYWDNNGSPYGGTALSGCATGTASGNNLMGVAAPIQPNGTNATTATDSYVRVIMTAAKRTATIAGSVTADDITGSDATLNIVGLGAATGGLVAIAGAIGSAGAGGAASVTGGDGTAGAGGAASLIGGAGNGANAGGVITVTGGAGGAAGAGGAVTITGGAPASGNAAGGASSLVGGAGSGTGAGGAIAITGGDSGAGSTGNGGAVVAVGGAGASTDGDGGLISTTGGAGIGGGDGGAASLVGGASGATGTGGAIAITGGASSAAGGTAGAVTIDSGALTGGTGAGILIGDANAVGVTIGAPLNYAAAGGAADVQTLTLAPAATRYVAGMLIAFRPVADNTGACTINVNALGAKSIKTQTGADPAAADLEGTTGIALAMYDGTNFVLINPATTCD